MYMENQKQQFQQMPTESYGPTHVDQASEQIAEILRPMFIHPPESTLLAQFTTLGNKIKADNIKDRLIDEVIGTVCSDDVNIPMYILSRLVLNRSDSQELASVPCDLFLILSKISGKTILKRSDLPTFGKWLVAKHPSLVRKLSSFHF